MTARWPQPLVQEGIEAIVLLTVSPQPTLWESVIPQCRLGLPGDLAGIDRLLDDPRLSEPVGASFDPVIGRPSLPLDTHARVLFPRYRYRLRIARRCAAVAVRLT